MRLLSFRSDDGPSFGALVEGRIVDLGQHMPEYGSLRDLLEAGALVRALDTAAEESADYRADKVTYLPPIADPGQILIVNHPGTTAEPVSAVNMPAVNLVGHGEKIVIQADLSAPLAGGVAVIIGENASNDEAESAGAEIAGITLIAILKPDTISMGPFLVTPDELPSEETLTVNALSGEAELEIPIPDLAALIAQAAESFTLATGDIVAFMQPLPPASSEADAVLTLTCAPLDTLSNELTVVSEGCG